MNNNEETSNNHKNHKKIKTNREIMNITKKQSKLIQRSS